MLQITQAESLAEPEYNGQTAFKCLSPISISTLKEIEGRLQQHFLDYMNPDERNHFKQNLYNNLCQKFHTLSQMPFTKEPWFEFSFDPNYILKNNGKISKLIHFKNNEKIKCFEAPFIMKTYPELVHIACNCGLGDKNSAGLGCIEAL